MNQPSEARTTLEPPKRLQVDLTVRADRIEVLVVQQFPGEPLTTVGHAYSGSHSGSTFADDLMELVERFLAEPPPNLAYAEFTSLLM